MKMTNDNCTLIDVFSGLNVSVDVRQTLAFVYDAALSFGANM